MKKLSAILLILALALSFTACNPTGQPGKITTSPLPGITTPTPGITTPTPGLTTPTPGITTPTPTTSPTAAAGQYKNGTYTAKGDAWENGQEDATVVVKDGKISDVTLRRLTKDGTEVDYTKFDGKEHDGKLYPNLKEFKETMADKMVQLQKTEVDIIAGATTSTRNWTVAATRALEKAK